MSATDGSTSPQQLPPFQTRSKSILKRQSDLSPLNRARTREDRKKTVAYRDGKAGLPLCEVRLVDRPEAEAEVKSSCCALF